MKRLLVLASLLWAGIAWGQVLPTLNVTLQNAATATGNGTQQVIQGYGKASVQTTIATTATVVYEVSIDDGTTWNTLTCYDLTGASLTSSTATQLVTCNISGMEMFRARISAWTAGAVTVKASFISVGQTASTSSITGTVSTNLAQVGGVAVALGQTTMASSIPVTIASNQSNLTVIGAGTAGTANAGVMSVQGIASMTPVQTDLTKVAGASVATGHGTASGAVRVELPTDGTGIVGLAAGSNSVGTVVKATVGSNFYNIKKANLTTASVNFAFGFTSRKLALKADSGNSDEVCIDFTGGTAACPAANTAGNYRMKAGETQFIDDIALTSISAIAASGTQTFSIEAMN